MRLLLSFAALFLSIIFLQLGTGGVAPLDALSGVALGFSRAEIGLLGSAMIEAYGPAAMFALIAAAHVALIAFGFVRMRARPAPADRTPYVYTPRTSFLIGRLLRRPRGGDR